VNLQQKSLRKGVSKALLNQYVIMTSGIAGLSIPVSGYYVDEERPAEIRLSFSLGNTGDSQYPSGAFVDATSLTSDAEYQVVPIPAAVLLLGSGLVGVLALGKTRRKSGITGQ
jgi:hypothetical protein